MDLSLELRFDGVDEQDSLRIGQGSASWRRPVIWQRHGSLSVVCHGHIVEPTTIIHMHCSNFQITNKCYKLKVKYTKVVPLLILNFVFKSFKMLIFMFNILKMPN